MACSHLGTSTTEKSVSQNLICGLVTDGVWTLDFFYWLPTNTTATAVINMKTPGTFNATIGTCTFTADAGWTGDAATCVLNTGYIPSTSGRITQNNASAGVYITIGSAGYIASGADAGGNYYSSLSLPPQELVPQIKYRAPNRLGALTR